MSASFRVLSVIPPMTQLNTPYPSTAYLTGFLRSRGIDAVQEDLALALVLKLFTPAGLEALRGRAGSLSSRRAKSLSPNQPTTAAGSVSGFRAASRTRAPWKRLVVVSCVFMFSACVGMVGCT